MKACKKLAAMAFAIVLSLLFTVPAYSITKQELNKLPIHYNDITFNEVFTKCFSVDAKNHYSMKGDRPLLLLFVVRGCPPCISAKQFLNWMIDYRKDSRADYYRVMMQDSDKDKTPLYDLAAQFGIPRREVTATPIIMLFNKYGNLVFYCVGFPSINYLPFYKNARQTPEWKNFDKEGAQGQDIIDLIRAYDNL